MTQAAKFYTGNGKSFSPEEQTLLTKAADIFVSQYGTATNGAGLVLSFSKVDNGIAVCVDNFSDSPKPGTSQVTEIGAHNFFSGMMHGALLAANTRAQAQRGVGYDFGGSSTGATVFATAADAALLANAMVKEQHEKIDLGVSRPRQY